MPRISKFQLYAMLFLFLSPLAFLEIPEMLTNLVNQNAWLAALLGIIPGYLMIFVFNYILQKSRYPFPQLLIEHLGQYLGGLVGFFYILFFVFLTSFTLRFFTDFIETNVLPGTPISIHIGVLLLALVIGLRSGIVNIARLHEVILIIALPFIIIILALVLGPHWDTERLLPVGHVDYKLFAFSIGSTMFVVSKLFIVLTLGFWCEEKGKVVSIMVKALWTYIIIITLTTMATIMTFGGIITSFLTFPTFSMVTLVNIGNFIQNIDIIFIGFWILGIYAVTIMAWFMACYSTQILFGLKDYKFLAAPSSLMIGIISILISSNILELLLVTQILIPIIEGTFFIIIPLIIFFVTLFKPYPVNEQALNAGQNDQMDNTA